jgi:hydrogenase maturation protease
MPPVLIIAYGNPLRSDDGIAWRAADALDGKFPNTDVEILRLHQLAPEVADACRKRELVLFMDAACVDDVEDGCHGEIRVRRVSGAEVREHRAGQFSHVYSPSKVLDLARQLYNASPKAYVITVAGENFAHAEYLSRPVESALPELIGRVEQVVEDALSKPGTTKDTK